MRTVIISAIIILFCMGTGLSAENDTWTYFKDEKTDLIGYKDSQKRVTIKPRFIFTVAHEFNNIMAVIEPVGENKYDSYYLLKNGKKVGNDNLYMWDNSPDCESEGKIRFRDKISDKVGFYDRTGMVVIPADYNDALPFRNNMAIALKNAERYCHNGIKYSEDSKCEHWTWKGGQSYLINTYNEILINDFEHQRDLDWFSLNITDKKNDGTLRESFKGANGKYYSFVNFRKEFKLWFETVFLPAKNIETLQGKTFYEITFWVEKSQKWVTANRNTFLKKNSEVLLRKIKRLKTGGLTYEVFKDGLNQFIFESDTYDRYYDSCGASKKWQYPVFDVAISYYDKKNKKDLLYQDHLEFLRTDDSYKLISLSLRSETIKN